MDKQVDLQVVAERPATEEDTLVVLVEIHGELILIREALQELAGRARLIHIPDWLRRKR